MTDHPTENARLRAALEAMLHAVCSDSGFAAAVRQVSGLAYPWPALDDAEANARALLATPAPDAPKTLPTNCREWFYYPIEMPVTADGNGPATVGEDATKITYEVWDMLLNTHSSHDHLSDALNEAMRLNMMDADAPAPDAVQEADGVSMQTLVDFQLRHFATASAKARSMRHAPDAVPIEVERLRSMQIVYRKMEVIAASEMSDSVKTAINSILLGIIKDIGNDMFRM